MIGKTIVGLLKADEDLIELIGSSDKIFPYIINENTTLPAIIYTVDSVDAEYNKDGWAGDEYSFSVVSISDNYATLQSIVEKVRGALELERGDGHHRIELTGMSEGFSLEENVFINKLIFSIVTF